MKLIVFVVEILLVLRIQGEQNRFQGSKVQENIQQNEETNNLQSYDAIIIFAPDSVDWRNQGIISPIKNQGTCYAESAFSAASQLQTIYYSYKSQMIDISQQYILSCTGSLTSCTGRYSSAQQHLLDINNTKKIALQSDVPYTSSQYSGSSVVVIVGCQNKTTLDVSNIPYFSNFYVNVSENKLIQLISQYPVLSQIKASNSFYNYKQGIFSCSNSDTYENQNYDVQVIGYNKNQRYYIIKNSMGTQWGQQGYGRISMDNDCGIKRYIVEVTYGTEKKDNNSDGDNGQKKDLSSKLVLCSMMLLVLTMLGCW